MPRYRSREEMMSHRLSVRINGKPEKVDQAAILIKDQLDKIGTVVEWTKQFPDKEDPEKVNMFLNVDTNKEVHGGD